MRLAIGRGLPRASAKTSWRSGASPCLSRVADVATVRELKQRRSIGAHGSHSDETGPPLDPPGARGWPHVAAQGGEGRRQLGTEAPSDFDADDNETCPARARKLGVPRPVSTPSCGLPTR